MDKTCQKLLDKVEENQMTPDPSLMDLEQDLNLKQITQDQLNQCIQELNQFFPQNFVFTRLFNGCERALTACLIENASECVKQVKKMR